MNTIVTGSQWFGYQVIGKDVRVTMREVKFVHKELDKLKGEITNLYSDRTHGPACIAEQWARANGIPITVFEPDWIRNGKLVRSAAYSRNARMSLTADALILFWDRKSTDVRHILKLMQAKKRKVRIIDIPVSGKAVNLNQQILFAQ